MIYAIIQARMGSTRLPGKVLMDLDGETMLDRVINNAEQSNCNKVIVATTWNPEDDILADRYGAFRYDGKLPNGRNDVLARYYHAAQGAKHIVRLTADCPLVRPWVINEVITAHLLNGADFTNTERFECGLPNGLGAEMMTFDALETAYYEATDNYDREHVTSYFYRNPDRFYVQDLHFYHELTGKYSVDTIDDLWRIRGIYGGVKSVTG